MPPYSEADVVEDGVQCYLCDKFTGKTWLSIMDHLRKMHGVSMLEVADTYLGEMARAEGNKQRRDSHARKKETAIAVASQAPDLGPQVMPAGGPACPAVDAVRTKPDGTSWRAFWVKTDPSGSPIFPLELEAVSAEPAGAAEPLQVVEKFCKPTCKHAARPQQVPDRMASDMTNAGQLQEIRSMVAQLVQPTVKGPEVALPTVSITAEAAGWTADALSADARRHAWPIRRRVEVDLTDFVRFLRGRALGDSSVEIAEQGVGYFFALLDIEPEGFSLAGAVARVYTDNIATALFDLPLLSLDYSWTRKIVDSMSVLCTFLVTECGRLRWDEIARCIRQLSQECFESKKKASGKKKRLGNLRRMQADAERLTRLPPVLRGAEHILYHQTRHSQGGAPGSSKSLEVTHADLGGGVYACGTHGYRKHTHTTKLGMCDLKALAAPWSPSLGVPFVVVMYVFSSHRCPSSRMPFARQWWTSASSGTIAWTSTICPSTSGGPPMWRWSV